MKAEEEGIFRISEPRNASPLSSPGVTKKVSFLYIDSESSFVEEKDTIIQHKVESSLEDSSEESTASSLKRRLRNLPSPSESSPFCERSAIVSTRHLRKERDFFYHLQELSNSIEEKDEAEVSSASSETRISSAIGSRLQNPRARRRAKMLEASKNQNIRYTSKLSTDSDRESVQKSSRGSSLKVTNPKIENREDSELSQNSSRCEDSSGGRLRFNQIDLHESGKLSNRSNFTKPGERKHSLYRSDLKSQNDAPSPLSPSSPLNFAGTFPILSNSTKTKKIGGYRPASILLRNLSSESESDTGNDKILQNLMLERLKARDDLVKLQSEFAIRTNQQSSIESNSSSTKLRETGFLSRKEAFLNSTENSARINRNETKIVGDFEDLQNQKLEKTAILLKDPVSTFSTPRDKINPDFSKSLFSTPNSNRSDPSKMDRCITRIPSLVFSRSNKNVEENSPSSKSAINSVRSEINFGRENSTFQNKKLRVPTLEIRSHELSPSISSKERDQQSLDMKFLNTALSDVSLKRENAFGHSEKSRSDHSGNKQFQSAKSSHFKTCFSSNTHSPDLQKIPTRIPERIFTKSSQLKQPVKIEPTKDFNHRSNSSSENNSAKSLASRIEKTRSDSLNKDSSEISRFENIHETLTNIFTSRTEYSEVRSSQEKRSIRSFELAPLDLRIAKNEERFSTFEKEEVDYEIRKKSSSDSILNSQIDFRKLVSEVIDQKELFPVENFSSDNFPMNEEDDLSSNQEKLEDSGGRKLDEILSDALSSKPSSTENRDQEENDLETGIVSSSITKFSSSLKLDPISVLKTSEQFVFESQFQDSKSSLMPKTMSNNQNAFILPRPLKETFPKDSNKFEENFTNTNLDRLFSDFIKENSELIQIKSETKPSEQKTPSREVQQTKVKSQSEKEAISDDSLINMFESCIGDSNQQGQRKLGFHRELEGTSSHERRYQEPQIKDLSISKKDNDEFGKDAKEENSSLNLIESSAFFNSMKLAKSDSTAILSKKSSNHPNLPTKTSSSMSKLTCLLDSMKKETQDRFPFTISESTSRNSSKFKVENDQDRIKETLPELEDEPEEICYKLDTHPSITRLALSGTEPLPSELINCVSYESPSQARKFLPRMRCYVRRLSTRFRKKKQSKNAKSDPAKILFKNSECRLESIGSSGDTMELQFLGEEIEDSKVSTEKSAGPQGNPKSVPSFSEESDKRDRSDFWLQRFDSETESGRVTEIRSSRAKSSPVNIKHRRAGFPRVEEPEPEDFQGFSFEDKAKGSPVISSPKKEVPSVDAIRVEVQKLQSQSRVESSCFCFRMCRTLVQPSVASPESQYLASTRYQLSKKKKKA